MNNMRRGFTMIELIFVIVIIGILAAVAIPKLQGVSEDAEIAKVQAYAGSLTRTVMPGIWSKSLRENKAGDVSTYGADIKRDLPAPIDIVSGNGSDGLNFAAANFNTPSIDYTSTAPTAPSVHVAQETIDGVTYQVVCNNGDKYKSPECDVWDGTTYLLGSKSSH